MSNQRVLVIEDEKHISKLIKYNLEKAGFLCTVSITAEDALQVLDTQAVALIILDIMLPKMDGFEFCRKLRQDSRWQSLPVIMLTARGEEVDRIVGLELGADDYMVKPFSPRELVLRVKAVLKRGKPPAAKRELLTAGAISIDIPRHKVTIDDRTVDLSPMEFKLLVTLLERQSRVQSREQLLNDVWGLTTDVTTRTVDTHVKLLRQKLGRSGRLIQTVRGIGYKLED